MIRKSYLTNIQLNMVQRLVLNKNIKWLHIAQPAESKPCYLHTSTSDRVSANALASSYSEDFDIKKGCK